MENVDGFDVHARMQQDDPNQIGHKTRIELDTGLSDFFDPAVDEHSEFYHAMESDKNAAHLVAGTSFLSLNNVILTTECNNAYESMNEEDMQKLRKLMWNVYVPSIEKKMNRKLALQDDTTDQFKVQMYVVHLSIRVSQALQLIFELNQKKSFSAVAKTAYQVALQDVLYHPNFKGRVDPHSYRELINYLRRHPAYSTAFNTYVGYKLLRQQLVRSGGAGTNRKSNDAERLHDEAANRLWSVLNENRNIYNDFKTALNYLKMEWHAVYYKEVAETLFDKLTSHDTSLYDTHVRVDTGGNIGSSFEQPDRAANGPPIDLVNAIQEIRETVSEGPSKRSTLAGKAGGQPSGQHQRSYTTATLTHIPDTQSKRHCPGDTSTNTVNMAALSHDHRVSNGDSSVPAIRRAYDAFFN